MQGIKNTAIYQELTKRVLEMDQNMQCTIRDDEYIGQDGRLYCTKCGTSRSTTEKHFGKYRRVKCKCQLEEQAKEEEIARQMQKQINIARLQKMSLLGEKYKNANFDSIDIHSNELAEIVRRCKRYTEVAPEVLKKGLGIYLWGDKGTGKTHTTACMINALIEQFYTVLCTNFGDIGEKIKETFKAGATTTEEAIIKQLVDVDFLFIDDFGTEKVTRGTEDAWLQEKVFEIINKRYNNNKPVIYSSNYSLRQLIEERGVAEKTIDRIAEVSTVLKLQGRSYRAVLKERQEKIF